MSAPDTPDRSPSLLAGPPKRGIGVRRLNKLPIVFAAGGAMLVAAAIGYTYRDRLVRAAANATTAASHRPPEARALRSSAAVEGSGASSSASRGGGGAGLGAWFWRRPPHAVRVAESNVVL